ncbi:hypothetical protein [Neobacillus sp. SuZ13]|uniref:hypothetical protein n=1 Tax=Neobacillus sp. SuZ13 TaxID=3047875 RepID=UPI0024C0B95D|nr:hypothetical protein [Neobacillus sp. SuZ13]WHY69675.1 hypothetical protein QNH17_14010 [Neobacillus sp. SuZ13]
MKKGKVLTSILIPALSLMLLSGCGNQKTVQSIEESIKGDNTYKAKDTYEEAMKDLSLIEKEELKQAISKELITYLDTNYKNVQKDKDKEAAFYDTLNNIEEIGITDNTLKDKLASYKEKLEDDSPEEVYVQTIQQYLVDYNTILEKMKELYDNEDQYASVEGWLLAAKSQKLVAAATYLKLVDVEKAQTVPSSYSDVHQLIKDSYNDMAQAIEKLIQAKKMNDQTLLQEGSQLVNTSKSVMQEAINQLNLSN